jgi:hypothetical protein
MDIIIARRNLGQLPLSQLSLPFLDIVFLQLLWNNRLLPSDLRPFGQIDGGIPEGSIPGINSKMRYFRLLPTFWLSELAIRATILNIAVALDWRLR